MLIRPSLTNKSLATLFQISGVYGIRCRTSNKWYVGQSVNIQRRYKDHLNDLSQGKHANIHLQRAFVKYSSSEFEFHILRECPVDNLNETERNYIEFYKANDLAFGYNICQANVDGKLTYNESFPEIIRNSRSKSFKITANDAKVIRELYVAGYTPGFIIETYKMNPRHISNILGNIVWPDPSYEKPKKVPALNPVQASDVRHRNLKGQGINQIVSELGLNRSRIKEFFGDSILKSYRGLLLLNTVTGIFYSSLSEAERAYGVSRNILRRWLSNPLKNKTDLILV